MLEKGIVRNDNFLLLLLNSLNECARLREENERLRDLLSMPSINHSLKIKDTPINLRDGYSDKVITNNSSAENKIKLFRSLFRGRQDIYPIRWEGKNGRSGYTPACANEWNRPLCKKPTVKCSDCENRDLMPVTEKVLYNHLSGKQTIGVYPLLKDDTCWFLAVDFDKKSWIQDSLVFLQTCRNMGIPAALERSRSGNGGHIWIFFETHVSAYQARKLGSIILTKTMDKRFQMGLDSYDRFFPNQDTLPKGGFGNLIALPLQHDPREKGNSVFLDDNFQPYQDQWKFLSSIKKLNAWEIDQIINAEIGSGTGSILGIRKSSIDSEDGGDTWTKPSFKRVEETISGPFPVKVRVIRSNQIYIEKVGLPTAMLNRLIRLAAFQNPEFYKAQAMRLSTFGIPRIIGCAEEHSRYLGLPRGCLDEVKDLLEAHGIQVDIQDERFSGTTIDAKFNGELRPLQQVTADAMLAHDEGVLAATTAFGKTVVAAYIIASRRVNTLVLVHRRHLVDQWRERLAVFLDIPKKSIGQIGGGKTKRSGTIDVAVIQSLNRKGIVKDLVAEYGQVIIDECHHLSAFSFEQVLRQAKPKYVLGLTATPIRKDGHHPIIMMQCGPIRFKVNAKKLAAERPFEHLVIPRHTSFSIQHGSKDLSIHDIYAAIITDDQRNDQIFDDLLMALEEGRSPLLLTERTEHVEYFAARLKGFAKNVIVLRGGLGKKQRRAIAEQLEGIPDSEERVIIATGRYIGEGFDDPRLDTLFLVMPISWRGTLQQYAGRLHRTHQGKNVVQVYDYVDSNVPMLMRMYEKRLKGYNSMGYRVLENQDALF